VKRRKVKNLERKSTCSHALAQGREEGGRLLEVQGRAQQGRDLGLGSLGQAERADCACRSTHPTTAPQQQSPP